MTSIKEPKEKPNAHYRFPKGSKVRPKGFVSINPDEEVTVITKGKVSSFRTTDDEVWDPNMSFGLRVTSCEIVGPEKKVTLDDAVKSARKKV